MSKHYKLYTEDKKLFIDHNEALILELKLNKSEYGKVWSLLGDILYNWRLDPTKYQVTCDMKCKVTEYQLDWIKNNIKQ
jgi:hypothetical protein